MRRSYSKEVYKKLLRSEEAAQNISRSCSKHVKKLLKVCEETALSRS